MTKTGQKNLGAPKLILMFFVLGSLVFFLSGCNTQKAGGTQNTSPAAKISAFFTDVKDKIVSVFTGVKNMESEKRHSLTDGQKPFTDNK